jgi:putative phage-type endonuclease
MSIDETLAHMSAETLAHKERIAERVSRVDEFAEVIFPDIDLVTRDQWLEARRKGIGGSDAAAALGLSPWKSPYALWAEKAEGWVDDRETEAMEAGLALEHAIGEWWSGRVGIPVTRDRRMLRSRQWPWMVVNLDFIALLDEPGPLEVKNVGLRMSDEWIDGEKAPDHYRAQVIHAQAVTGLGTGFLSALVGGQSLRTITVERDEQAILNLAEAERQFWQLVQRHTPPEVDGSASTTVALNQRFASPVHDSEVELDPMVLDMLAARKALKQQEKEAGAKIDAYENTIKAMLGNAEIGTVDGKPVVTWKKQSRSGYVVEPSEFRKIHVPKGVL